MKLSARIRAVEVSATLAIKAEADRLRAAGQAVLDLGVGEPDLNTPEPIKQAAVQALADNFTHYTDTAGILPLREALAGRYRTRYGAGWNAGEVIVGCGAKSVLFALAQSLIDPGDEVALFAPYWVSYPEQVKLAGGRTVIVPTRGDDGFIPRAADLARALTPATRLVILNSPCNPSGAVTPPDELAAMAQLARERDLTLISDETYEGFCYDGQAFPSLARWQGELADRLVVVSAFSKTYAMTGWRVGYALGPAAAIKAAVKLQSHDASQASSISQKAALAALGAGDEIVESMRAEYERRRNFLHGALAAIPALRCARPGGAFYLFVDVTGLYSRFGVSDAPAVGAELIRRTGCVTVPGDAFGMPGFLRLSYAAAQPVLEEAARRIAAAAGAA